MRLKNLAILLSMASIFVIASSAQAEERRPLPEANDPFWQVMSQLNRPDDATCTSKVTTLLTANSVPDAATRATETCQGIAQMVTSMQPDMQSHGVSTNLFDATDWHHINNLYFEHATHGKIQFSREIDFMSYNFMRFFENLTSRLEMQKEEIGLDADIVNGMRNTGTIITMKNVSNFDDPQILVDNEIDSEGIVSGLTYDRNNRTITFNAAHFTSFKAVESSSVGDNPKIKKASYDKYLSQGGKKKIKFVLKGDRFNKDADVKLGSKKAYKVKRTDSHRLVAYFKVSELKKSDKEFYLKVVNPGNKTDKYKTKYSLSELQ